MGQRHLVMADDSIVKIGHVQRAVRAELEVHRTEPRIVGGDEVGSFVGQRRRAGEGHGVTIDAAGHDVASENVVAEFSRPEVVLVIHNPGDRGRAVSVEDHRGGEAEAVVGFAEARIITAAQELIDGLAVAIRGIEVAERVEAQSKRVDLAPGVLLDAPAVEGEAIGVARIHFHFVPVPAAHIGVVVVTVRGVKPAVEAAGERRVVAVRVALPAQRAVKLFFPIGFAIAVGILEEPEVGDGPGDAFPRGICGRGVQPAAGIRRALAPATTERAKRIQADGNIQSLGEGGDLASAAVGAEILEDHDAVATLLVRRNRERVFPAGGHPEPAARVEGHVHRLVDVRFGGHQLNLETGREVK